MALRSLIQGGSTHADGTVNFFKLDVAADEAVFIGTCASVGRSGPTVADCQAAYAGTTNTMLQTVDRGVQKFVIRSPGQYTLSAYGAAGGWARMNTFHKGGQGATATATFNFTVGTVLNVAVGQYGGNVYAGDPTVRNPNAGGGGGGATFVWIDGQTTPLLVAGGGGGASGLHQSHVIGLGGPGTTTVSGTDAEPQGGRAGAGGGGGVSGATPASSPGFGGGGAGWIANGDCTAGGLGGHVCGMSKPSFLGGFEGATGFSPGGFGGGGGAMYSGGGGGGYSGGGGGSYQGSSNSVDALYAGGGGGGSFASGVRATVVEGGNAISLDGLLILERPCSVGRSLNALGVCVELDACLLAACTGNATCTDLPAPAPADATGRTCSCNAGYSTASCTSIDACIIAPCSGTNVVCSDLPPPALDGPNGRTCVCSPGYSFDGTGQCADVDGTSQDRSETLWLLRD
jgi:hypothetical protein